MTRHPPDNSRDRRIEDRTNLWLIHPAARALLPVALRYGVSANAVSGAGLVVGAGAAIAFGHATSFALALVGLVLAGCWLVADGLDGMVARATGTASPFGRLLDGLCDHGVFALLYIALAASIGTPGAWALAAVAGVFHAFQSNLYEAERARFHRRLKGDAGEVAPTRTASLAEALYDSVTRGFDRLADRLDGAMRASDRPQLLGSAYGERAVPPMRLLALLTANARVLVLFVASLAGDPRLFWWIEIVPMTIVAILGTLWLRRIETTLARGPRAPLGT
jgi:CDP-diacylglycerol--serine O-phosphatidyltransferase